MDLGLRVPPPHGILADRAWGGGIGYRGTFGTGGYPVPAGYRAPAGTQVRPYPHGYPGQRRRPPPAGAPAGATSVRRSAQTTVGRFWGALASAAGRATAPPQRSCAGTGTTIGTAVSVASEQLYCPVVAQADFVKSGKNAKCHIARERRAVLRMYSMFPSYCL